MSLVNRMLLDLEERDGAHQAEPALAGLSSVEYCSEDEYRTRKQTHARQLLAGGAIVAAVLAWWFLGFSPAGSPGSNAGTTTAARPVAVPPALPPAAPEVTRNPAAGSSGAGAGMAVVSTSLRLDETLISLARLSLEDANVTQGEAGANPADSEPVPQGGRVLSAIALGASDRGTKLQLQLSADGRYLAYALAKPDRVVVELPDAALQGALPDLSGDGFIRRIRAREESGKTIIVLDLSAAPAAVVADMAPSGSGARLDVEVVAPEPAPQAVADATVPPALASEPAPPVIRPGHLERTSAAPVDPFAAAASLCGSNRVAACIGALSGLLAANPSHVEARLLLATTLLENGDSAQAAVTLDNGLATLPGAWQWAQMRAQMALNDGDAVRALSVLRSSAPAIETSPEYHALLAAVFQRTGRHEDAVATYRNVLARQPGQSIWWMGLGISLQALSRVQESDQAYARALADSSLAPDLRKFIQERRSMLIAGGES